MNSGAICSFTCTTPGYSLSQPNTICNNGILNLQTCVTAHNIIGYSTITTWGGQLNGICTDQQGNTYAPYQGSTSGTNLGKWNFNGVLVSSTYINTLDEAIKCYVDTSNVLWLANYANGNTNSGYITRVNLSTGSPTNVITGLQSPASVVTDSFGNLFILQYSSGGGIWKYSNSYSFIVYSFGSFSITTSWSLTIDLLTNNLYVTGLGLVAKITNIGVVTYSWASYSGLYDGVWNPYANALYVVERPGTGSVVAFFG